jgi:hypothetical protein
VVGGSMYSVPVRVPRRFYINMRHPDTEADCGRVHYKRRAHHMLPHGHPAKNLYEVELPEEELQVRAAPFLSSSYVCRTFAAMRLVAILVAR